MYGPSWIMEEAVKAVSYYTICANSVGQRAAIAALKADPSVFEDMVAEYKKRSEFVYQRLLEMPGIEVYKPRGTFYIFPSIAEVASDGRQFALDLLDCEQVVVVPGSAFGPSGEKCFRIACTVGMDMLKGAMDKLEHLHYEFDAYDLGHVDDIDPLMIEFLPMQSSTGISFEKNWAF